MTVSTENANMKFVKLQLQPVCLRQPGQRSPVCSGKCQQEKEKEDTFLGEKTQLLILLFWNGQTSKGVLGGGGSSLPSRDFERQRGVKAV